MASNDGITANPLVTRLQAIIRDMGNKGVAKGQRLDDAVRRLNALVHDIEAGIEGGADGA